jgi:hypothetical protein
LGLPPSEAAMLAHRAFAIVAADVARSAGGAFRLRREELGNPSPKRTLFNNRVGSLQHDALPCLPSRGQFSIRCSGGLRGSKRL